MKKNNMKRIGFSLICMFALLFSFQGIEAQQVFGSGSSQDYTFDEYIFSETTPSDMGMKELSNSLLQDDGSDVNDPTDPWNPDGPDGEGNKDNENPVGTDLPIGDGLWFLLLSGMVYGGIIFIRKK